jgi:hypothetical protein
LKTYIHLFRGQVQCFELSHCSKTHWVLRGIVMVQCDFHWKCRMFQKELYNGIPNAAVRGVLRKSLDLNANKLSIIHHLERWIVYTR